MARTIASLDMTNPMGITISNTGDLDKELTFFHDLGYEAVELAPDAFNLLFCGELHAPLVHDVVPVLKHHQFRYTVHSPAALDLRDIKDHAVHVQMAESTLALYPLIHAE